MEMFEQATKMKLRFPYKGANGATTEDLWDLSLTDLDGIYRILSKDLKSLNEDSLLEKKSSGQSSLELKINIIKHIVEFKQKDAADRASMRKRIEKRQELLGIKARKQAEAYESMTMEDLDKELAELGDTDE